MTKSESLAKIFFVLASTSQQRSAVARLAQLVLPGRVHLGVAPEPVRRLSTGMPRVDAGLDGGIPCGRISELIGPLSSGKTAVALRLLAAATRAGEVVACVDSADALHPASLARAGADLARLLWVRPPSALVAVRCAELLLQAGGCAVVVLDLGTAPAQPLRRQVWPRLLHAAERSHTALVVVAPRRVAGSFSVLSIGVQPRVLQWRRGVWALFEGFDTMLSVVRNKLGAPGERMVVRARESCLSSECLTSTLHAHDSLPSTRTIHEHGSR